MTKCKVEKITTRREAGRSAGKSAEALERERVNRRIFILQQIREYDRLPLPTRQILEHPEYKPVTQIARETAEQSDPSQKRTTRNEFGLSGEDMAKVARMKEFEAVFLSVYRYVVSLGLDRRAVGDYSLMGFYGCRRAAEEYPILPASPKQCGAKTRGGSPCKLDTVQGRSRCRFHGGYTPLKKRAIIELAVKMATRLQSDPLDLAAAIALGFIVLAERTPALAPWEIEKQSTTESKRRYLARKSMGIPPAKPLASRRTAAPQDAAADVGATRALAEELLREK